jgi:hypothetical protein
MFRLVLDHNADPAALRRLLAVPAMPAEWREELEGRLRA